MQTYIYKIYTANNQTTTPIFSGSFNTNVSNHVTKFYQEGSTVNILTNNDGRLPTYLSTGFNFNDDDNPLIFGSITDVPQNVPDPTDPDTNYFYNLLARNGSDDNQTYINPKFDGSENTIYYVFITPNPNPPCFSEGTKILCLTEYLMEEYRLVQDLMVGDLVKAYMNDYKPIKNIIQGIFINNPKNRSNCMYIMRKKEESEGNGLIEDLVVTGNHGILLDEKEVSEEEQKKNPKWANFKVDDKVNCIAGVSSKFEQIINNDVYKYYHFSLDNGDCK
jgi:hypothetical protein